MKLECMECNHTFTRREVSLDQRCPRCGGYDVDVDIDLLVAEVVHGGELQRPLIPRDAGRR